MGRKRHSGFATCLLGIMEGESLILRQRVRITARDAVNAVV